MMYFFIAAFVIFLEGILDDFFNLPAYVKLVLQIVGALIITFSPLYVKEFVGFTFPEIVGRILTFLWILYIVNAFNLIDGLDLLCSGISFLSLLTIGLYMLNKDSNVAALCFLTCASLFGFLIFNRPPARIFLGDSGSQTLGFFVATIPLMCDFGSYESVKPVTMLLLVSIPAIDVIAAIWRRKRDHHRIFSPDRAHIHHKLINIGFSKITASYLLIGFQLLICIIVYVSLLLPETSCLVMLSVTLIFVIIFFCVIHFINRAVNIKMNKKLEEIKNNSN